MKILHYHIIIQSVPSDILVSKSKEYPNTFQLCLGENKQDVCKAGDKHHKEKSL